MKHASIVVTAEPTAPVYPGEEKALRATGNKLGSGHNQRWAVWFQNDAGVELIQTGFTGLRQAEEFALQTAKDLAAFGGKDENMKDNQKVVRVN